MTVTTWAELTALYQKHLEVVVKKYPTLYAFNYDKIPGITVKMVQAFKAGTYNNDGHAIKAMARELGIRPTYGALNNFFSGLK